MNGQSKEAIQWNQPANTNNNKDDDEFTCLEMLCCVPCCCPYFNCWDDCGDLCDDDN
jgi:hypothetical protein